MMPAEYPPIDAIEKPAWYATLGGRKFIATLLALIAEHHALFEKLITSGDYKVLVMGTVGAYITGNVVQKRVAP